MAFAAILAVSLIAAVAVACMCEHCAEAREQRWDDEPTLTLSEIDRA